MDIITNIYIKSVGMCFLSAKQKVPKLLYIQKLYNFDVLKYKRSFIKLFYTKLYYFFFFFVFCLFFFYYVVQAPRTVSRKDTDTCHLSQQQPGNHCSHGHGRGGTEAVQCDWSVLLALCENAHANLQSSQLH